MKRTFWQNIAKIVLFIQFQTIKSLASRKATLNQFKPPPVYDFTSVFKVYLDLPLNAANFVSIKILNKACITEVLERVNMYNKHCIYLVLDIFKNSTIVNFKSLTSSFFR